jgi:hypothetical protein
MPHLTLENYVGELSQLVIDQLQKEFNTGTPDLVYATTVSKLLAESNAKLTNVINNHVKEAQ